MAERLGRDDIPRRPARRFDREDRQRHEPLSDVLYLPRGVAVKYGAPRVVIHDATGSGRGPGNVVGVIDDPKNIGVSEYAIEAGEMFFTIPITHPMASSINPLQQHYTVYRYCGVGNWVGGTNAQGWRSISN